VKIFCDNKSAAQLFATLKTNNRVKHLNMRIQFIRELINEGVIAIHFVPTAHNVADLLTKALPRAQFEYLRNILMVGHGGKKPEWRFADSISSSSVQGVQEQLHLALTTRSLQEE
jgi:hypothetical protein